MILSQLLILSTVLCQDGLNAISTAFSQYHRISTKEKLFVHTDKSIYLAGEIAWFKLYDVDASNHKPLKLSKVAYVEILDSSNKHLLQAKIALDNAEGNGSFYLPFSLNSGNYKLRAYTNWMKNFGAEYFFEKTLTVINVKREEGLVKIKPSNIFNLDFFPEGGNLVNNIPSVVAFKATDEYGRGIPFKGVLLDNSDTLLTFKPVHAGMGSFSFTPLSHHVYKAYIKNASGESGIKELPQIYDKGYVMNLDDSAGKIRVTVQSDGLPQNEIYLFAHTREIVKVALSGSLQNGKAVFMFDKNILGDGISHITVFNDQKQPVCERLYFKKALKQLDIKLNTDLPAYTKRKKVAVNIRAGIPGENNDSASVSLSVYRLDSLQTVDAAAIDSYLLLTSDLKGTVEDPNYYFEKDNKETTIALDYLMLTNGWRRFKWEEILANSKPYFDFLPEFTGPIVSGTVVDTKTGIPGSQIESYLSVPGLQPSFTSSLSDNEGRVRFELKKFYGPSELILQTNTLRDSIYRVDMTDPFSNDFSTTPLPPFTLYQTTANTLLQKSIGMQVQNIYSGKSFKNFTVPVTDTTPFYINADTKYLLDNYTRFTTVEEILREYVTLVDVRKREGNFHFSVYDFSNNQMFKTDPLVLLDGVPVFDLNRFMRVDPLKLYKLEVLNRRYFLGNSTFDGVLNWTSYKGDIAEFEPGAHATIIDFDGLQAEREFYSPVYANDDQRSNHLPDFRNVLLWVPNIKIASGGSKDINFYTSDIPGKYAVQVQGITKNGLCGSQVFTFEVKK